MEMKNEMQVLMEKEMVVIQVDKQKKDMFAQEDL